MSGADEPEKAPAVAKPRMPGLFTRAFWTIDTVLAVAGLSLSLVSTLVVFYLTAGMEADLRRKGDEARHLTATLVKGFVGLFDEASTFATQRSFEAYLDAFADDAVRRQLNGEALRIALTSAEKHLLTTAPDSVPTYAAESGALLDAYAAGDDTAPAKIRALASRMINGPNNSANIARAERRAALKAEIPATQSQRDLVRALGGFLQVFGVIVALTGQIVGRKLFANRNTPRELRPGLFNRAFWTSDVTAVVGGTLVSLVGTALLFFAVDSYQRAIDETRAAAELRATRLEISAYALDAYEDEGIPNLWVADIQRRRTAASHTAPAITFDPIPGEVFPPTEWTHEDYIAHRRAFSIFWLIRVIGDDDYERYRERFERFQELSFQPRSAAYLALDAEVRREAGPVLERMAREKTELTALANDLEGTQTGWRDFGGLLQMIGLVLAFAGNLVYFKRSS